MMAGVSGFLLPLSPVQGLECRADCHPLKELVQCNMLEQDELPVAFLAFLP
jgi:hypothetical protein